MTARVSIEIGELVLGVSLTRRERDDLVTAIEHHLGQLVGAGRAAGRPMAVRIDTLGRRVAGAIHAALPPGAIPAAASPPTPATTVAPPKITPPNITPPNITPPTSTPPMAAAQTSHGVPR